MVIPSPPSAKTRPASAPPGRLLAASAHDPTAPRRRPCSAVAPTPQWQQSEIDSSWRGALVRAEQADRRLRQESQDRSADRGRAHMLQMRALQVHTVEREKQQKLSAAHRARHEQMWARQEEQLQAQQATAATTKLQCSHRRHKATQLWRSKHKTRTRQLVPSSCYCGNKLGARDRPRPTLTAPVYAPEDNKREALMSAQIDSAQSALAKERFALAQLPHELRLAAHETCYRRVRDIKGTVAAKELCDRHQIDRERELVFTEGRPSLQLTMRTTLGLELTQKSRGRRIEA